MKKAYFLALGAAAMIGCGGDDKNDGGNNNKDIGVGDMTTDNCNAAVGDGGVVPCADQTVSGFTVDIDLLGGYFAGHPNATAQELIMNSCVANTPVYALYSDGGQTGTVQAGADCTYSLHAVKGKKIHVVAAENAATHVLNTYSQDEELVADEALTNIPAHICSSNQYSAPVGLAAFLGVDVTEVQAHGVCMFGTNAHFQAPFVVLEPSSVTVSPSSFTVYANMNPGTMPPTFAQQASTPSGIVGLYDANNDAITDLTVNATDTGSAGLTYAPYTCQVRPNFISFGPHDPSN